MIIVKVELHGAVSGQVQELARMEIANTGKGSGRIGEYLARTLKKGTGKEQRRSGYEVTDMVIDNENGQEFTYPRVSAHVWVLVARALTSLGYK